MTFEPFRHPSLMLPLRLASSLALAGLLAAAPAHAAGSVDHAPFTRLLAKHVRDGVVDYGGLLKDRGALDGYLATLRNVPAEAYGTWPVAERIAYWLDVYNAETLALMLEHPGAKSIKDVRWFGSPFRLDRIPSKLRGRLVSLDHVEHDTLRREFDEPRIHFALVCASTSCPPLRSEAYTGERLEAQLSEQARRFLADGRRNRWDPASRTLSLSRVFKWFREDFDRHGGPVAFAARWLPPAQAAQVRAGEVVLEHLPYDWSLNGHW